MENFNPLIVLSFSCGSSCEQVMCMNGTSRPELPSHMSPLCLPLNASAPGKRKGGMSQDLSVCRYALNSWSAALQTALEGEPHVPERRHTDEARFEDVRLG